MSRLVDTDETAEQILEIIDQETRWKNKAMVQDKVLIASEGYILNLEGRMRVRIKTILDTLVESAEQDGKERANEDREPTTNWSDRD